jgi:hypothetical protein
VGLDWSRLFCFWNGDWNRVGMCTMKKLINRKYVDPSIPGIAYQLATWERNSTTAQAENRRQARLHAAIMMRAPLPMKGGFNG